MAATINGSHANENATPKIHLYTNHGCPFAHRAHIVLEELGLPFEETLIDLQSPRPQWYLDINPRGLVPTIKYTALGSTSEETIYESAIVAQFLCDTSPSHLLPSTTEDPSGPLKRARINFFIDTWTTKVNTYMFSIMQMTDSKEKEEMCDKWFAAVEKEIEPLLANATPFYGGSKEFTFAEAIVAPAVVRWYDLAEDGEFIPKSFTEQLDTLPNFSKWAKAVRERNSVNKVYDAVTWVPDFKKVMKQRMAAKN